jgi:hypothetical protein
VRIIYSIGNFFLNERAPGCAYFIDIEEVYETGSDTEITGVYLRCSEKDRKILRPRGHPRWCLALNFRNYGCWCSLSAVVDSVISLLPDLPNDTIITFLEDILVSVYELWRLFILKRTWCHLISQTSVYDQSLEVEITLTLSRGKWATSKQWLSKPKHLGRTKIKPN